MSTKVHDEDDATFDEVDVILENAKAGLQMKRSLERKSRRNINLSDIPENFAHVPAASSKMTETNSSRSPAAETPPPPKLQADATRASYKPQRRNLVRATLRWFRNRFMGCVSVVDCTCNMCGCQVVNSAHVSSQPVRRRPRP